MPKNKMIRVREPSGCLSMVLPIGKQHSIEVTPRLAQAAKDMVAACETYQFTRMVQTTTTEDITIKAGGIKQNAREYYMGIFDEAGRIIREELSAQRIPCLSTDFIYDVAKKAWNENAREK